MPERSADDRPREVAKPEHPAPGRLHAGFEVKDGWTTAPGMLVSVHAQSTTTIGGPLPSAAELAAIKAVDPDALALILRMVERQQLHDHNIEARTLQSETAYRQRGIYSAMAVIGSMMAVAATALLTGHASAAAVIAGTAGLASVGSVFIRGRSLSPMQKPGLPNKDRGVEPRQAVPTHPPPTPH